MTNVYKLVASIFAAVLTVSCYQQSDTNSVSADSINASFENTSKTEQSKVEATVDYQAQVDKDIANFRGFYEKKFPNVKVTDFKNGAYAIDEPTREQWQDIEEFPPYELSIDEGEEFYAIAFANGKTYADCFENGGLGIRQNYPHFDEQSQQVITLELAINQCRKNNGESTLKFGSGELAAISAYMAYSSRDYTFALKVNTAGAYDAYLKGKEFFYSKRGQLNFACADCHLKISGSKLRAEVLSPAIGHPTGMPVYRSKWGDLGTLHKRYRECNKNVRAEPLAFQSQSYRNLEFFQTVMSAGFVVNGPSSRK